MICICFQFRGDVDQRYKRERRCYLFLWFVLLSWVKSEEEEEFVLVMFSEVKCLHVLCYEGSIYL